MGVRAGPREVLDGVGVDRDDEFGGRAEDAAGAEAGVVSGSCSIEGVRVGARYGWRRRNADHHRVS